MPGQVSLLLLGYFYCYYYIISQVPFWQMEILARINVSGQGKEVSFKLYTQFSSNTQLTSVSCSSTENIFFVCYTISQVNLDLIHSSWPGHPS